MSEEIRPGLLVVIVKDAPEPIGHRSYIGELFTIKSGPQRWRDWHPRIVWAMEERHPDGCSFCFARDEFHPLPPPDDIIANARKQEATK